MKKKILSKILTVLIVFLALICLIIFYKIMTKSEVSVFGIRFYYVLTESMYPTIKPDALMVVKTVDADKLEVGDIISFESTDPSIYGLVNTHRICGIVEDGDARAFVTMGDNNPVPDEQYVYEDAIKGKVIAWTPPMKWVTDFLEFSGTKMGFFIVILIPLMIIMAMFMKSFVKEFKKSLHDEEQAVRELYENDKSEISAEKQAARKILELYFGKPLSEVTEEDIEKKLSEMDK